MNDPRRSWGTLETFSQQFLSLSLSLSLSHTHNLSRLSDFLFRPEKSSLWNIIYIFKFAQRCLACKYYHFAQQQRGGFLRPRVRSSDIANHSCEFTGNHGHLDYSRWLPNEDYQLGWIDEYLRHKTGQSPSEAEVLEVYNSVRKFMLCAHLQWSIWSVIQAENSSLDFDFVDYALQRFQQYKRWKSLVGITRTWLIITFIENHTLINNISC